MGKKRKTTQDFVEKSISIHGNRYDYSKVNYINNSTKVEIVCRKHGSFQVIPYNHYKEYGGNCPECAEIKRTQSKRKSLASIKIKTRELYGEKYIVKNVFYGCGKNKETRIKYICSKHGIKESNIANFLKGHGCQDCSTENWALTTEEFIKKANEVHKFYYDYSKTIYTKSSVPVTISCPLHGDFQQTPTCHIHGKSGCALCKQKHSRGELEINDFLLNNNIFFKKQYRINDCRNKNPLPFDFAIFENAEKTKLRCLIEYDGKQHFESIPYFNTTLESVKKSDNIKSEYCKKNNIHLIRIPYFEFDNIQSILEKCLCQM